MPGQTLSFPEQVATERLVIRSFGSGSRMQDLGEDVVNIMTEEVTASLPPPWQGSYTLERALEWLKELNDEECITPLSVVDKKIHGVIGFVLLFAEANATLDSSTKMYTVRIGYMLAKESWGKGYATEIVAAIINWAKAAPEVTTMIGGVARNNVASQSVLLKNGFVQQKDEKNADEESEELMFVLNAT